MKKPTIRDVAAHAGVSTATVSYVLNNVEGKSISPATKEKIHAAISQLGYVPNNAAKTLKNNSSNCVVIRLATTLAHPKYYETIQGICSYLNSRGYYIVLYNDTQSQEGGYIDLCLSGQAQGIIYFSSDNENISEKDLHRIKSNQIPISFVDCMPRDDSVSSVNYDYFSSTLNRAQWAIDRGYKKFIYFRPSYTNIKETRREQGVNAALAGCKDLISRDTHFFDAIDLNVSKTENVLLAERPTRTLSKANQEIIAGSSPDTFIICSAPEMQDHVARFLFYQSIVHPDKFSNWHERGVSYQYSHQAVGTEAARSLLSQMRDDGSVRKITIPPTLKFYDPNMFY